MRILISVLYVSSVAFVATGVVLVLRNYQWDRVTLGLAMSKAESPGAPPLPLLAVGLFPFAFPEDEDQRQLESFLDQLRVILTQATKYSETGHVQREADATAQQSQDAADVFDLLRQATRIPDIPGLTAGDATLVGMMRSIATSPEADASSTFVRQYRSLANEYQAWAGLAPLRKVTRDLYRRRGSERLGAYIALSGAVLDITATMLWLWVL